MPRRGLPGVLEYRRNFARGHRSAVEMDREENATPGRVGEGCEDDLIRIEPGFRITLRHDFDDYSAARLNVSRDIQHYG